MTDQTAHTFRPRRQSLHRTSDHPWLPKRVHADLVALREACQSPTKVLLFGAIFGALGAITALSLS